MTDQNAPAADFTLSPEQFEEEMNQPLFEGPMMMAYDEAQAVYGQCLHYASLHCNDAIYCKSLIALSEVHLHKEEFDKAITLLKLALEVLEHYLPACHERVGALHYLLAATYQFNADYELACKHWFAVIQCFNWLPADAPVLREAAQALLVCKTKQCGMLDPDIFGYENSWYKPDWYHTRRDVA